MHESDDGEEAVFLASSNLAGEEFGSAEQKK